MCQQQERQYPIVGRVRNDVSAASNLSTYSWHKIVGCLRIEARLAQLAAVLVAFCLDE